MCVLILIVLTNGLYYYLVRYLCCKQQKRLKLKQKKEKNIVKKMERNSVMKTTQDCR